MNLLSQILTQVPVSNYILLASMLFSIGVFGVLLRRNTIVVLMCVELMLNAVNLLMVAFSTLHGDPGGQVFVFFIMAVAAAEVAVGLSIVVLVYRNFRSVDINMLNKLKD